MTRRLSHASARKRGFSLLEMLVALVILSFSLGALYQGATAAIRNVAIADEYTRAVILAESMLASTHHVAQEQLSLTGTFDIFSWEANSWPVQSALDASQQLPVRVPPLQHLKVIVRWPGGSTDRQIVLSTVVPLQEQPE